MVPIPRLTVKKECPNARTIEEAVKSSKRGLNKNEIPFIPPASVIPRTASTASRTTISGIIIFDHFSIPPFTPFTITQTQKAMKNT